MASVSQTLTPNSRLMMRILRDAGDQSRTTLSEVTRLSPTTVTKAVTPLLQRGWVVETGVERPGGVGRPAITVSAVPAAVVVCGVQIGTGKARVGLADGRAQLLQLKESHFSVDTPPEKVLSRVAVAVNKLIDESPAACLGVGVSVPGPVDQAHRTNLMSINLGWRDVPVADILERAVDHPVVIDHNVRTMALAEQRFGGHDVSSLAYIYASTGVGLGIVLQGEPFVAGTHGISAVGHIRVQHPGLPCVCGSSGCLETVASEPSLVAALGRAGVAVGPRQTSRVLSVLEAHRDRKGVTEIRQALVDGLSDAVGAVANLINPEIILLGGHLTEAPEGVFAAIQAGVERAMFPLLRGRVRIERPHLPNPGVTGAATLALEGFVYGASSRDSSA